MRRLPIRWAKTLGLLLTIAPASLAQTDEPPPNLLDNQTFDSPLTLRVRKYATVPSQTFGDLSTRSINSMTTRPGDTQGLYVTSLDGRIHRLTDNAQGQGDVSLWYDVKDSAPLSPRSRIHGGLRDIAFHPDFNQVGSPGYGKVYGSLMLTRDSATSSTNFLGSSRSGLNAQGAVAEWTFDFGTNSIDDGSYRELFRVQSPQFDHPIKQLEFNPHALPGDADYGALYIAHGDGSVFNTSVGTGQTTSDALGKILRINPIEDTASQSPYQLVGNAFELDGDPNTLAEVFTWGHRNPHNITFGQTVDGRQQLLVAEVGQDNIDEVNLIKLDEHDGENFGWNLRTGTFTFDGTIGYGAGAGPLPANEASAFDLVYPVLQLDHDDLTGDRRVAIAGGVVIDNWVDPTLQGRYFYGDFATNSLGGSGGEIWSAKLQTLADLKTSLDPGESPESLEWIDDFERHPLAFDHDDNPSTADLLFDDFIDLLEADGTSGNRSNIRFGEGPDGALYVSSKQNGSIYLISNTKQLGLPGDATGNGVVNLADYNLIQLNYGQSVLAGTGGDVTFDGRVDLSDFFKWKQAASPALVALVSGTIPEPSALLLIGMSTWLTVVHRRRA